MAVYLVLVELVGILKIHQGNTLRLSLYGVFPELRRVLPAPLTKSQAKGLSVLDVLSNESDGVALATRVGGIIDRKQLVNIDLAEFVKLEKIIFTTDPAHVMAMILAVQRCS